MTILICPGIHPPELTQGFIQGITDAHHQESEPWLIYPAPQFPAYSAADILRFLTQSVPHQSSDPLTIISFSAGVVGAIGAAWGWQGAGYTVKAFMACDGWGVPLVGPFPIYRLSHDYFTHWSSALLGTGDHSFYADPPVDHLELWHSPQTTTGWWVRQGDQSFRQPTTAALFVHHWLWGEEGCGV